MGTRTIVTSQPDVACYVCERRLLRGEQPEVFLAGGRPRTVCELCAPRAANAGWAREVEGDSVGAGPQRPRRGRGLFDRLRGAGRAGDPPARTPGRSARGDREAQRYDFLDASAELDVEPAEQLRSDESPESRVADFGQPAEDRAAPARAADGAAPVVRARALDADGTAPGSEDPGAAAESVLDRSVEVFNAGEYPRRVAGLARSLGAPGVSVRLVEGIPNVVEIVVAWELCWYRYRVDLDDVPAEAHVRAQGTNLSELAREDRLVNAAVSDLGMLSLPDVAGARR
jgi:hypothetical protein